jgi:hypothetical protein|tara:strand:- start:4344 stop:5000 length:657 start_codon:yes stop_codon:yes gene_type:complete
MILITSMGGCASTSFIGWASSKIECNCPLNSEGIRNSGPGSNPKGLKHRISPPRQSDSYLSRQNSFDRTDLTEGPISRAVFLYDNPYSMVLSLFRRNIAMGHAMAVTGKRATHRNELSNFLNEGVDSFKMNEQFDNWVNPSLNLSYPRLLINFNSMWDNIEYILGYMGVDPKHKNNFLRNQGRVNRMDSLSEHDKSRLIDLYGSLHQKMNKLPGVMVI